MLQLYSLLPGMPVLWQPRLVSFAGCCRILLSSRTAPAGGHVPLEQIGSRLLLFLHRARWKNSMQPN